MGCAPVRDSRRRRRRCLTFTRVESPLPPSHVYLSIRACKDASEVSNLASELGQNHGVCRPFGHGDGDGLNAFQNASCFTGVRSTSGFLPLTGSEEAFCSSRSIAMFMQQLRALPQHQRH